MRIWSPGPNFTDSRIVWIPEVAFSTSAILHSDAPTKSPNSAATRRNDDCGLSGMTRRRKNSSGCAEYSCRSRSCSCWTTIGQAPNEPWLRKMPGAGSDQRPRAGRPKSRISSGIVVFILPHSPLNSTERAMAMRRLAIADIADNPMDFDHLLGFPEAEKETRAIGAADPFGLRSHQTTEQERYE